MPRVLANTDAKSFSSQSKLSNHVWQSRVAFFHSTKQCTSQCFLQNYLTLSHENNHKINPRQGSSRVRRLATTASLAPSRRALVRSRTREPVLTRLRRTNNLNKKSEPEKERERQQTTQCSCRSIKIRRTLDVRLATQTTSRWQLTARSSGFERVSEEYWRVTAPAGPWATSAVASSRALRYVGVGLAGAPLVGARRPRCHWPERAPRGPMGKGQAAGALHWSPPRNAIAIASSLPLSASLAPIRSPQSSGAHAARSPDRRFARTFSPRAIGPSRRFMRRREGGRRWSLIFSVFSLPLAPRKSCTEMRQQRSTSSASVAKASVALRDFALQAGAAGCFARLLFFFLLDLFSLLLQSCWHPLCCGRACVMLIFFLVAFAMHLSFRKIGDVALK